MIYRIFTTLLSFKPLRYCLLTLKRSRNISKLVPMMNEWHEKTYIFQCPSTNLIGHSSIQELENILRSTTIRKALIVTDKVLIQLKTTDSVIEQLTKANIGYNIFDGVLPNPTIAIASAIVDSYTSNKCDGIISIGGGSAHDAAKAACLLLSNKKKIHKCQGLNVTKHILSMPLICVNTTAGTGSEVTNVAVITDEATHFKMTLVDKNMLANITVNDSNLMLGLPQKSTVYTGVDALTHAIEADLSIVNNDLVQAYSHQAMHTIFHTLPKVYNDLQNIELREQMVYGEYLAGIAFNSASLGFIHSMSHAMSAVFNTPHGLANAILMPYVLDYELTNERAVKKLAKMCDYLNMTSNDALNDTEKATKCVIGIAKWIRSLGIELNLNAIQPNISKEQINSMAKKAMKDFCGISNPVQFSKRQLIHIYNNAILGNFDNFTLGD